MNVHGLPTRKPAIEVVEDPDVNSFREAVQVVYDAYPQYADYIARIQAELA